MAIVVEDATGLSNSETYLSVADYKSYWLDRGVTVAEDDATIEAHLRLSTEYIDLRWGSLIPGDPIATDQALIFPTTYYETDPVSLPVSLKRATAEYTAWSISNGLYINDTLTSESNIKYKKEKLGPIEEEIEYFSKSTSNYPKVTKGDALMRSLSFTQQGGVIR